LRILYETPEGWRGLPFVCLDEEIDQRNLDERRHLPVDRLNCGAAHVIALVIMLWGLVLAADEVLPRSGYARYSATWWCADFGAQTDGRQRIALWSLSPD